MNHSYSSLEHLSDPEDQRDLQCLLDLTLKRARALPQPHPQAILMAGGSGAGKSRLRQALEAQRVSPFPLDAPLVIDPDELKLSLPGFLRAVLRGQKVQAEGFHRAAITAARDLVAVALEQRCSIILDTTLSSEAKAQTLIAELREADYAITVVGAVTSLSTALERVRERTRLTGRAVPRVAVIRTHQEFWTLHETLAAQVDALALYDTSRVDTVLLAQGKKGAYTVMPGREKRYTELKKKVMTYGP